MHERRAVLSGKRGDAMRGDLKHVLVTGAGALSGYGLCARARQQCLYFLPLPHGQGSLRPIFAMASLRGEGVQAGFTAPAQSEVFSAPQSVSWAASSTERWCAASSLQLGAAHGPAGRSPALQVSRKRRSFVVKSLRFMKRSWCIIISCARGVYPHR